MTIQSLAGTWEFRRLDSEEWLPARVPGGVHTDLLALDRIPDPFAADYEKKVQWVAESDWAYRLTFSASQELISENKIFLVCDGLDTLATVVLNGQELGKTNNMFRRYEWEVKSFLETEGFNELIITFDSPVKYASEKHSTRPLFGVEQAIPGGPHLRKAPCQFGWDWGPKLPPVGIWKDIRLEGYSKARFSNVHLRQIHSKSNVTVEVTVEVGQWEPTPLAAVVARELGLAALVGTLTLGRIRLRGASPAVEATASKYVVVHRDFLHSRRAESHARLVALSFLLYQRSERVEKFRRRVGFPAFADH